MLKYMLNTLRCHIAIDQYVIDRDVVNEYRVNLFQKWSYADYLSKWETTRVISDPFDFKQIIKCLASLKKILVGFQF